MINNQQPKLEPEVNNIIELDEASLVIQNSYLRQEIIELKSALDEFKIVNAYLEGKNRGLQDSIDIICNNGANIEK